MKTSRVLFQGIIILSLLILSCKKEAATEPIQAKDLTGQWEWIYSWLDAPSSDSNPRTPANTGIREIINYGSDKSWLIIRNGIHLDSGTFSTGHGSWSPYNGVNYIYDSIVYYKNGLQVKEMLNFYDFFGSDTLVFSGMFRGLYAKGDPTEGASKFYLRLK